MILARVFLFMTFFDNFLIEHNFVSKTHTKIFVISKSPDFFGGGCGQRSFGTRWANSQPARGVVVDG